MIDLCGMAIERTLAEHAYGKLVCDVCGVRLYPEMEDKEEDRVHPLSCQGLAVKDDE